MEININKLKNMSDDDQEYANIIFNLSSGLKLEHLSNREIEILERKNGPNWKIVQGYVTESHLLEKALNELREWHEHDKALNSPNIRHETSDLISEIELLFSVKGKIV